MATAIKGNPILSGEDAIEFLAEIKRNDREPMPTISEEDEAFVEAILKSREKFPH